MLENHLAESFLPAIRNCAERHPDNKESREEKRAERRKAADAAELSQVVVEG